MTELLSDLIVLAAAREPEAPALRYGDDRIGYGELNHRVQAVARAFVRLGATRSDRIAVYLEKRPETVISLFAASTAGAVFVPINPLLRSKQVQHILKDSNARILVTSPARLAALGDVLGQCPDLRHIVTVDGLSRDVPEGIACLA